VTSNADAALFVVSVGGRRAHSQPASTRFGVSGRSPELGCSAVMLGKQLLGCE
jgi:hypothetical protein